MRVKRGEISEYIHKYLVTHRFRELEPNKQDYKRVLKDIHTETVKKTIQSYTVRLQLPLLQSILISSSNQSRSRLSQLPAYGPTLLKPLTSLDW